MSKLKQIFTAILLTVSILTLNIPVIQSQIPILIELPPEMAAVYVYPSKAFGAKGTLFTVSVKIFNLTNNFYQTDSLWEPGDPLGPPGALHNYSLGNVFGFDLVFRWDPEILEYVDRLVMTPVEDYPEGVLHAPIHKKWDTVDYINGTYSLSQTSWFAAPFNCPDKNVTIFEITFKVKEEETSPLILEAVELMLDPTLAIQPGIPDIVPHQVINGEFCRARTIRIISMYVGALVGTQWLNPLISGEDVSIKLFVFNEGDIPNNYNLTLYNDEIILASWRGERLDRVESREHIFMFKTTNLARGLHEVTAKISVNHYETRIEDSFTKNFTVIYHPHLNIITTPSEIQENETATLSAESSYHQDLSSYISNYKWHLYEPEAEIPTYEFEGESITHTFTENGSWTIVLTVEDNWGITFDPLRPATAIYQITTSTNVGIGRTPTPILTQEQTTIIIIFILMTVASLTGYFFGKWRS